VERVARFDARPHTVTECGLPLGRRFRAGEHLTELAVEYGVNRKTLRRRLDAFELADAEREARIAAKRLRRQAERERRTLRERERVAAPASARSDRARGVRIGERAPLLLAFGTAYSSPGLTHHQRTTRHLPMCCATPPRSAS
jgi:hypothetical protein